MYDMPPLKDYHHPSVRPPVTSDRPSVLSVRPSVRPSHPTVRPSSPSICPSYPSVRPSVTSDRPSVTSDRPSVRPIMMLPSLSAGPMESPEAAPLCRRCCPLNVHDEQPLPKHAAEHL